MNNRTAARTCWRCRTVWQAILILFLGWSVAGSLIISHHEPNDIVRHHELVSQRFHGNHSHIDYFRLLQRDGDSILIGARNIVYNISIKSLTENVDRRIVWHSKQKDSDMCFFKGKSEAECQNYIRVLAKKDEGEFLVCGTNAYKPLCRDYSLQPNGKFTFLETSGVGKCPFNPRHNSTFVFTDGELYSGTVADFQELVPIIFKDPLRTDHNDLTHINAEPSFVHSFSYRDYVFFFFREQAVEYMNCGKRVFSRVARVCKNDKGEKEAKFNIFWTSYLKSRLNCSFPGEFPFYFDEIQSVSDVVTGIYEGMEEEMIYAVFTTPRNSIPGSAVCAFSMRDILDAFEGSFKEQKDIYSNWLAVPPHRVPEPRPGSCVNDSRQLPKNVVNFALNHPLMDELVPAYGGKPLFMKASFSYRFTKLAVDPQVRLSDGSKADVIFIATDTGKILKVVNPHTSSDKLYSGAILVEEIHPFDHPVVINNLQLAKLSSGEGKLIVITDEDVIAIPLYRCDRAKTCFDCVDLQDPYCGWNVDKSFCSVITENDTIHQNISSGYHAYCPIKNTSTSEASTMQQTTETPVSSVVPETCPPCVCTKTTQMPVTEKPLTIPNTNSPAFGLDLDLPPPMVNEVDSEDEEYKRTNVETPAPLPEPKDSRRIETLQEITIAYAEGDATGPVVGAAVGGPFTYSAETLAVAVTTACVGALVVGFILGFLFSRKCRGDDYPHFSDTPYLDSKLNRCDNLSRTNMYSANNTPPKHINNLVTTYNPKDVNTRKSNVDPVVKPAKCAYI